MDRVCDLQTLTTSGGVSRRSCSVLFCPQEDTVFLFGGVGPNNYYNDLHMLHIPSKQWSECYPIGSKPEGRGGSAHALLDQRTGVIWGGRGESGFFQNMYTIDLVHLTWSPVYPVGQQPSPREDAVMATSPGNLLYVTGGCGTEGALADLWRYDPRQAQWDLIAPEVSAFPDGIAAPCACQTDREWYLFGGYNRFGAFTNELWSMSLVDETWRLIEIRGSVPRPRTHGQLALCDGALLLYGGYGPSAALSDVWQLVALSAELSSSDCLVIIGEELRVHTGLGSTLARGAAASVLRNRTLLVFGGCDGTTFLQDLLAIPLDMLGSVSPIRRHPHLKTSTPRNATSSSLVAHDAPHPYNVQATTSDEATAYIKDGGGRGGSPAPSSAATPQQVTMQQPRHGNTYGYGVTSPHNNDRGGGYGTPATGFGGDGDLMSAISQLKAEFFGPRLGQVDTLVEENRKLREENAKLQQTVLDLMRKLSNASATRGGGGGGYGANAVVHSPAAAAFASP